MVKRGNKQNYSAHRSARSAKHRKMQKKSREHVRREDHKLGLNLTKKDVGETEAEQGAA